jgi:cytochrome c-type biogenesis protein CcmE
METGATTKPTPRGRTKFIIGGLGIVAAIIFLVIIYRSVSSIQTDAQYFMTIEELLAKKDQMVGHPVRISGVVLGDTIQYDPQKIELTFTVANVPGDNNEIEKLGGLAKVLHTAALDLSLPRVKVIYHDVRPDLLKNEAQAIMTGTLGADGVFTASELLLKCPTKYEDAVPQQAGK